MISQPLYRSAQSPNSFRTAENRNVGSKMGPTKVEDLPLSVVVPGFVLSELRTGFQMGFLLFIPFILIDFVVAIVLMSLGLLFLPPVTISMPLKILLFVLVDGWTLVVRSLALSFGM